MIITSLNNWRKLKLINMLRKIYNRWVTLSLKNRVNVTKTIGINLLLFPLRKALHFPILIYGPCKLGALSGKIVFLSPIKKGLLKIGLSDNVRSWHSKSFIEIRGTVEVGENVVLRRGISLSVRSDARIVFEDNTFVADNNTIISFDYVYFGRASLVGNNSVFMDTDFHYVIRTDTREIKKNVNPIIIGENCWIGGWCIIKKGTQLPKGTIVAGPYSMVGKNYMGIIPEYSLIAGSPAKMLMENVRCVNNQRSDIMIDEYLKKGADSFILPEEIDVNTFCTSDS